MANYLLDMPFVADTALGSAATGPDLATSYDYFVGVKIGTADDHVTAVTGVTDNVIGVAQQRVATADAGTQVIDVRVLGVTKWLVGTGGVTRGTPVNIDATGKVVAAGGTGTRSVGLAMRTGAAGDIVGVLITPGGRVP